MKNLKKIARIAAELENQLGIVNDIEEEASNAIETEDLPEPSLEAADDVVVNMEGDCNGEVIAEECPECGQEPCVCDEQEAPVADAEEPMTVEQMAEVADKIGRVASKVRASSSLTVSQKNAIIAKLGKLGKLARRKQAAGNEGEDPKFLQIVQALKFFASKYNSFKTKKAGQLLGIASLSSVTLEELFDAIYSLAMKANGR